MVRVLITNCDVEKSVRPIVVVKCISRHTLLTLDIRLISPSVQALYPLLSSFFSLFLTPSFGYIYVVPRVHSALQQKAAHTTSLFLFFSSGSSSRLNPSAHVFSFLSLFFLSLSLSRSSYRLLFLLSLLFAAK